MLSPDGSFFATEVAVVSGSVSGTLETILRTPPQALVEVREAVPSVADSWQLPSLFFFF